ncbi:uncharacterized protein BDZ99DRAFT_253173 [Mytilinidion resinicola]|uniref:Uncharacterized protein n=1 Tax=Mytilinidion resinicola TaxID=574789 RepID=A0A6A6YZA4_9PEZI|nr:uncharacterized protein BDZ99DRAFT_253173 [Mytilinidion resinicola]KAF2813287.1 hypothetical protein BDZ99DRAFT_253173 [Mytilinidion resinicola]
MKLLYPVLFLTLATLTTAAPSDPVSNFTDPLLSFQLPQRLLRPLELQDPLPLQNSADIALERNTYITCRGSELFLSNTRWTASGTNVYWLGLDENVIPPAGAPFYALLNASYPTKARITEIMNTVAVLGGRTIRSQTLGG